MGLNGDKAELFDVKLKTKYFTTIYINIYAIYTHIVCTDLIKKYATVDLNNIFKFRRYYIMYRIIENTIK